MRQQVVYTCKVKDEQQRYLGRSGTGIPQEPLHAARGGLLFTTELEQLTVNCDNVSLPLFHLCSSSSPLFYKLAHGWEKDNVTCC